MEIGALPGILSGTELLRSFSAFCYAVARGGKPSLNLRSNSAGFLGRQRVVQTSSALSKGRVIGARPGQQIVLYAKSGTWWVQPVVGEPFTEMRPDATWTNSTHLGTQYAALLVEPGFRPTTRLKELPTRGDGVAAVAIAEGVQSGSAISKSLQFSGYDWRIRNAWSHSFSLKAPILQRWLRPSRRRRLR